MSRKLLATLSMGALILVGAGCSSTPSPSMPASNDAVTTTDMQQALTRETFIGEWKVVEGSGAALITFNADGTFRSVDRDGAEFSKGPWKFENGVLTFESSDYVGGGVIKDITFNGYTLNGMDSDIEMAQVWEKSM